MKMQKQTIRKKAGIIQHMVRLELLNTQEICQHFVINQAPWILLTCIFKMSEFRNNILGINKDASVSASGFGRSTVTIQILKHHLRPTASDLGWNPEVLAGFCDFIYTRA